MSPKTEGFPFTPSSVPSPIVFVSVPTTSNTVPSLAVSGDSVATNAAASATGSTANTSGRKSPFLFFFSQPLEPTSQNSLPKRKPRSGLKCQQKTFKGYRNVACGTSDESETHSDLDSSNPIPKIQPISIDEFTKSVSLFLPIDASTQTTLSLGGTSTSLESHGATNNPTDFRFNLEKVKGHLSKDVNIVFRKPAMTAVISKKEDLAAIDISSIDKGRGFEFSFKPNVCTSESKKDIHDSSTESALCRDLSKDGLKEIMTLSVPPTSELIDKEPVNNRDEKSTIHIAPNPNKNEVKPVQLFPSAFVPSTSSEPKNLVTGFSFSPVPLFNFKFTDGPHNVKPAFQSDVGLPFKPVMKSQMIATGPYDIPKPHSRRVKRRENYTRPILAPCRKSFPLPSFTNAFSIPVKPVAPKQDVQGNIPKFKTFVKAKRNLMRGHSAPVIPISMVPSNNPFKFVNKISTLPLFPAPGPDYILKLPTISSNPTFSDIIDNGNRLNSVISLAAPLLPIPPNKQFNFAPRVSSKFPNPPDSWRNNPSQDSVVPSKSSIPPDQSNAQRISVKGSAVVSLAASNVSSLCQPMASLSITQGCEPNSCVSVNTNNLEIQITNNTVKIIINPHRET